MKLRFQKHALRQIDAVLGSIAARSPQGAARVETRLTALLLPLQEQSRIGTRTRILNVRRVFLTPYPYAIDY